MSGLTRHDVLKTSAAQLAKGRHNMSTVNKSGKPVVLDSFNIYE